MTIAGSPRGIDVSNHQGDVDWDAVSASGVHFAFAKATEGNYYNDPYFSDNWKNMHRVALNRGAYHFARPSSATPDQEASFFLASISHAGGLEPGDMLVLDLEDEQYQGGGPYGSAGEWALGFCTYVSEAVGFDPIIYTGKWYIESRHLSVTTDLGRYPLWLAAYQADLPETPAPWPQVSFWQYSDNGRVPGVVGPSDMNVFNGMVDRIPMLGKPDIGIPPDPANPEYNVGPGILDKMTQLHDAPATNEHYVTPDWSEAYGQDGIRYVYVASKNQVYVYYPE